MCTGMCSCRDCKNTVEIESDVKSDDERDECEDHGNSDAYDDEEDIQFTFLFMNDFIYITTIYTSTILLVFVTDEL